jgi:hypothetical protein
MNGIHHYLNRQLLTKLNPRRNSSATISTHCTIDREAGADIFPWVPNVLRPR